MLAWEVFTLGGRPYETWPDEEVVRRLKDGEREQQPPGLVENVIT